MHCVFRVLPKKILKRTSKIKEKKKTFPLSSTPHIFSPLESPEATLPKGGDNMLAHNFIYFTFAFIITNFLADLIFPHFSRLSDFSLIEKELLRASYLT